MFAFPRGKRTPAGLETQPVSGRLSEPAAEGRARTRRGTIDLKGKLTR
jgi:hypothetical protein